MTRKRIRHALIPNEGRRNATFGRRVEGFLKKANEYSTLCGVDMGIIIQKHGEGENSTVMWPSPDIFRARLQKFMEFPDAERARKMVTHEKFLEQQIASETDILAKSKARTQLKESEMLMNQLTHGAKRIDELNLHESKCVQWFTAQMLEKLEKREAEIKNNNVNHQQASSSGVNNQEPANPPVAMDFGEIMGMEAPSPTTNLLENLRNDQWFLDTMAAEQNRMDNYLAGVRTDGGGGNYYSGY